MQQLYKNLYVLHRLGVFFLIFVIYFLWFQEEEYLTFYPDQVISVIERLQITDVSISKSSGTGDIRIYKKGGYVSIKWFTK